MELLRSAAALISKVTSDFGFGFGEKVELPYDSFWELYDGIRKEDGLRCSIFVFNKGSVEEKWAMAQNALSKIRTLHHPYIIRYLNGKEIEGRSITIVTERVIPLNLNRNKIDKETSILGLYQISTALQFIHENALSVHGNVRISSIFVNESGEWKIFGLELFSLIKEKECILYTHGGRIPDSFKYMPPEIQCKSWGSLNETPLETAIDAYSLGCLIYEIFNGTFRASSDLTQRGKIPQTLFNTYKKLLNPKPTLRLSVSSFINYGRSDGGFFRTELIECSEFLEQFSLKDKEQRNAFLRQISDFIDKFPKLFLKFKVLPGLIRLFEFNEGGNKAFSLILKIGNLLENDYQSLISPFIAHMFLNQNKSIRLCLLENLSDYANHISNKVINDEIFPKMLSGFNDTSPLVREETVKAVLFIVSKLSEHNINNELLKYLLKTQRDQQPEIRTNTTICLGKIAKHIKPNNRQRILISAFTGSLQDSFVPARIAALMALRATYNLFDESVCCIKLIPTISPMLIDNEKSVRIQAKKTIDLYFQKVTKLISALDNTSESANSDISNIDKSKIIVDSNSSLFSKNKIEVKQKSYNNSIEKKKVSEMNVHAFKTKNTMKQVKENDLNEWNNTNSDNTTDLLTFDDVNEDKNYINNNSNEENIHQLDRLSTIDFKINNNISFEWKQNIWDNDWDSDDDDNWKLNEY
ncbi:hypothetical protein PNEG_02480 [Pneumocystis murina B123]|uniref:Protein kinase domain-containing protein n=1 Tax=Pneumocystis murina (strain B123) TaxID=1069680 RepID=M7NPF2_PNEMU|nr:hypothetical protein PNEG_02480 [Pneumocystis murina B123]EMR09137.1 hypothetical protein PNEG_02480 [Pneumocystis murina B123]